MLRAMCNIEGNDAMPETDDEMIDRLVKQDGDKIFELSETAMDLLADATTEYENTASNSSVSIYGQADAYASGIASALAAYVDGLPGPDATEKTETLDALLEEIVSDSKVILNQLLRTAEKDKAYLDAQRRLA